MPPLFLKTTTTKDKCFFWDWTRLTIKTIGKLPLVVFFAVQPYWCFTHWDSLGASFRSGLPPLRHQVYYLPSEKQKIFCFRHWKKQICSWWTCYSETSSEVLCQPMFQFYYCVLTFYCFIRHLNFCDLVFLVFQATLKKLHAHLPNIIKISKAWLNMLWNMFLRELGEILTVCFKSTYSIHLFTRFRNRMRDCSYPKESQYMFWLKKYLNLDFSLEKERLSPFCKRSKTLHSRFLGS